MPLMYLAAPAQVLGQDTSGEVGEQVSAPQSAAEHFDRGLSFFEEGRFDAALAEFSRAHELAPAHQTLYNLARVHAAMGHAVEAADAYRRYLIAAVGHVSGERIDLARTALQEQAARIGQVWVQVNVPGATLTIDGVDVATTPLTEPLLISAGTHALLIDAPEHEPRRTSLTIAGGEVQRLTFELRRSVERRGTLRIETSIDDVEIFIDGRPVGSSPLESSLSLTVGEHRVVAERAAYRRVERQVLIENGAEAELSFTLHRSARPMDADLGRLRLDVPQAPHQIRIDGDVVPGREVQLPIGPHRIQIEVSERRLFEGEVRISSNQVLDHHVTLSWTLDARQERVEGAESQRVAGATLSIVGAVLILGGGIPFIWNEDAISRTDSRLAGINRRLVPCDSGNRPVPLPDNFPTTEQCQELRAAGALVAEDQIPQDIIRALSLGGGLLGVGLAALGLSLWSLAPSDEAIDRAASAHLSIGPAGLTLWGRF